MSVSNIRWTWHRLRAMGAPEIVHRVSESLRRNTARRFSNADRFAVGSGPLPALPDLAPLDIEDQRGLPAGWRRVAEAAALGRYRFLGLTWPNITTADKWHLDPETGSVWPSAPYCFDISCRHLPRLGDIKYVFELNRLQYLQPIAALAAFRCDRQLAAYCAAELESWVDANPPFHGVNWYSGIELALRIVSFCTVTALIGESAFSQTQSLKLRQALNAHGYWLERYPSRYSSANNHLIAEAAGLFLLGTLAPDLPGAVRYEAYGRRILMEEARKQILDDGVGAEQSPTYASFTIEWLLLCLHVANSVSRPFPVELAHRLSRAGEYLRWLTDDGGNQPRIGDDDEGRVFYSQIEPESYVSSVLGCIAATLVRPDLAPPRSEPHLRNLVFGFPPPPQYAPAGVRSFGAGGYTAARETIGGKAVLLVLDHGPLGYLSIAAHGHADALSLLLHVDDQPVFIDAGTYRYHSGGVWRDYFRGTRAHNTLNVESADQSGMVGPFNWAHKADARLLHVHKAPGAWSIEAEHDGYYARFGIIHRRSVTRESGGRIICTDRLLGVPKRKDMNVEIRYLVAPELDVLRIGEYGVRFNHAGRNVCAMRFCWGEHDRAAPLPLLVEPATASPHFGEKRQTSAIICRVAAADILNHGIATEILIS